MTASVWYWQQQGCPTNLAGCPMPLPRRRLCARQIQHTAQHTIRQRCKSRQAGRHTVSEACKQRLHVANALSTSACLDLWLISRAVERRMVRTVSALDPPVLQLLQQPQVVPSARTLTSPVAVCRVCRRSQAAARTQSVNDETTGDRQPDPTAVQAIYLR